MYFKFLTLALTTATLSYAPFAFSQATETTDKPAPTTAQDTKLKQDAAAAKAAMEAKLDKEVAQTPDAPVVATPAPEAANATAEVEALKTIFMERKRANYQRVALDFAKEKALNENSEALQQQTDELYTNAVQNLTSGIGSVSEPQAEETYFEYDVDAETGQFVIVQIRDSYLKAERGDVCQVSTQVHLMTSLDKELPSGTTTVATTTSTSTMPAPSSSTAVPAETTVTTDVASTGPTTESYTEIKCYNDKRTTYHQLLVK